MSFLPPLIEKYASQHTAKEPPLLNQLNRVTHQKVMMPQMLSGHSQGRALAMFSQMIKPKNILEIGTFTGYSAICLTEGMQKDGKLFTIDINEELYEIAYEYFSKAGLENRVDYRIGDAATVIPHLDIAFDLIYIDADKKNYVNYFNLAIEKIKMGGFIMVDNTLWNGKVISDKKRDKDTQAIVDFNHTVHSDPRVENVLLPIYDGLMILRKVE